MKQIRSNIFETNSSSSHSLVMSKKDRGYNFDLPVDERGKLTIKFDEFGWGPDVLYTPYEKLCYWMTEHASDFWYDWKPKYEGKSFEEKLQIFEGQKIIKDAIKTIKKLCKNVNTVEFESPDGDDSYYEFGYIDHESVGTIYGEDLKETVFNNSCIIVIDNDNSEYFKLWDEDYNGNTLRDPEEMFDNDINKSTWEYDYDENCEIVIKELNFVKR